MVFFCVGFWGMGVGVEDGLSFVLGEGMGWDVGVVGGGVDLRLRLGLGIRRVVFEGIVGSLDDCE